MTSPQQIQLFMTIKSSKIICTCIQNPQSIFVKFKIDFQFLNYLQSVPNKSKKRNKTLYKFKTNFPTTSPTTLVIIKHFDNDCHQFSTSFSIEWLKTHVTKLLFLANIFTLSRQHAVKFSFVFPKKKKDFQPRNSRQIFKKMLFHFHVTRFKQYLRNTKQTGTIVIYMT
jgi:hypothetical protein